MESPYHPANGRASIAITELAPRDRIGSAQALQAFIGFGATIAAPVLAGWMLDQGLGWGAVFAVGGLIGIALALPLLIRPQRSV
ncbi:MAG: hypothetical protein AB4911_08555 [Oscillochloridaceae bacterium umkhey_bin13]